MKIHISFDAPEVVSRDSGGLLCQIEHLLTHMEHRIMTRIKDYGDRQAQFNSTQSEAVDAATASVTALAADIQALNDKITVLQNSPGQVSPEDGQTIDQLEIQGAAVTAKVTALAEALSALDSQNPAG